MKTPTYRLLLALCVVGAARTLGAASTSPAAPPTTVYLVPNFHPACMGWLVPYSEERNYCLYSYLAHLDRVAKDPTYKFAFSEVPHLITMMEYEPERFEEFRQRVREGRVECVNAFVLEPTVSLSGGEALVQQGVQGLRWYKQAMDLRPRFCWMIDTCGWHEQTAQIVAGLGLEAFVYCRYNPTANESEAEKGPQNEKIGSAIHWIQSPDGTRVLALNPGAYADRDFRSVFKRKQPLTEAELREVIGKTELNRKRLPSSAPILILGGDGDYALPFHHEQYPAELIASWNMASPNMRLQCATPGEYLDAIMPGIRSGEYKVPTVTSGSLIYGWSSFWVNLPFMKQWYRRAEHGLQAAEALATIATLRHSKTTYPAQEFANAWMLMCLNMDRNILWGAGVDRTFRDNQSWDTWDRFEGVDSRAAAANQTSWSVLADQKSETAALFNPVNWTRDSVFELRLPPGQAPVGIECQASEEKGTQLVRIPLASMGLSSIKLGAAPPQSPATTELPGTIETTRYSAKIDPQTGALVSLKMKPSGREMLGGPANVVLAESKSNEHFFPEKAKRKLLASSSQFKPLITVTTGRLATIVEIRSSFFGGGELRRAIRFYNDSPRIDFITETNGSPDGTILSAEFPMGDDVVELRRGIPFGFSRGDCVNGVQGVTGLTKGVLPTIRWSDYTFKSGGGLALLDRGVTGRELVGNTAILMLQNACETYMKIPVAWIGDQRKQTYSYAILPHVENRDQADVPRQAWEYNSPVLTMPGRSVAKPEAFVETSDNVIIEALRRKRNQIELRLVESRGQAGEAWVKVHLPHSAAAMTDLLGEKPIALPPGPQYSFAIRPQQIVTICLTTGEAVPNVKAPRTLDPLIPAAKRDFMRQARKAKLIGHPPYPEQ